MKVWCGVYGEGSVFSVEIEGTAEVEALQKAIFHDQRYHERFSFPASALTLYLAKKDGAWLKDDDKVKDFLRGEIDKEYKEMRPSWKLAKLELLGPDFGLGEEEIHILVELPESAGGVATKQGGWSAKDLSTVDPDVQLNVWKSVVRVSSEDGCSGTALVVDRTATHLYLLTNLHLWLDKTFADHLSAEFKAEIKRYSRLHPGMKASGKRKKGYCWFVGSTNSQIRANTSKEGTSVFR